MIIASPVVGCIYAILLEPPFVQCTFFLSFFGRLCTIGFWLCCLIWRLESIQFYYLPLGRFLYLSLGFYFQVLTIAVWSFRDSFCLLPLFSVFHFGDFFFVISDYPCVASLWALYFSTGVLLLILFDRTVVTFPLSFNIGLFKRRQIFIKRFSLFSWSK